VVEESLDTYSIKGLVISMCHRFISKSPCDRLAACQHGLMVLATSASRSCISYKDKICALDRVRMERAVDLESGIFAYYTLALLSHVARHLTLAPAVVRRSHLFGSGRPSPPH